MTTSLSHVLGKFVHLSEIVLHGAKLNGRADGTELCSFARLHVCTFARLHVCTFARLHARAA